MTQTVDVVENAEGTFVPEEEVNTPVNSVDASDAITMEKATKLFNSYDQINNIKKMREEMRVNTLNVVGDEDAAAKLSTLISGLTPEEVRELSDAAVEELYNLDGEGSIEISLDFTKDREIEFKRDFLVYLRETDIANESIDTDLDALETEIKADEAQLKQLLEDFGDLSSFMRSKLQQEFDAAEGDRKDKLAVVIEAYDDSLTLNRVIAHYEKYGTRTTVTDYYHRADAVFAKYVKTVKQLNFRTDLTHFNNLETNLLAEKYHKHPNMFIFAIIKMFAYKKDAARNEDGVFLSQLAVNLKSLYSNSFASEEQRETFKSAIEKVLDLFVGE
jgi:hypothetical protein